MCEKSHQEGIDSHPKSMVPGTEKEPLETLNLAIISTHGMVEAIVELNTSAEAPGVDFVLHHPCQKSTATSTFL